MKLTALFLIAACAWAQSWIVQSSGVTASLRGVSAVSPRVVWASGSAGTVLRTTDGGVTWKILPVPDAAQLDFRGIQAFSETSAYIMSIGPGELSRIYRTRDGGATWQLLFTAPDPTGFFDALAFWDPRHGIVMGDPVDGRFEVFTTADAGSTWRRQTTPPSLDKEGAFAASNTCLVVRGAREAWFATGGPSAARVFHSTDGGRAWSVTPSPIRHDGSAAGIFSLAFSDALHGVAVGGDYTKPTENSGSLALTTDGGRTWSAPRTLPGGFRSAVAYIRDRDLWIATGTSGSDASFDGGQTWKTFDTAAYNAVSFLSSTAGWAVGPKGQIASFRMN